MTTLVRLIGRVMMTAVKLPRSQSKKYISPEKYISLEYRKCDQSYVRDCITQKYHKNMR